MRKISRGSDFSGVMAYVFDGDLDDPRELKGELIGGNMSGRTPEELTEEFNLSKAIRPDIKRPVWHNSLRLPLNEKIDKETWNRIGERYMEKMGFSQHHQRCYMLHDDPEGQHIHIPASRIGLDGTIFLGKNENLKSTKIIAELEVEFGLRITKGPTYDDSGKVVMPEKSKVSKNEIEKALRTGTEPDRVQLQKLVDQALMYKPSATQFVERLQASGVDVIPNIASTGRLNGFTFNLVGSDAHFSGSKLGDNYKLSSLEKRGLKYDKDRESGFLIELKARAGNAIVHDRAATDVDGVQPGASDRGRDSTTAPDAPGLRGVDSGADRASDRADHADPGTTSERVKRPEDERRDPAASADTSTEASRPESGSVTEAGTEAGTATERPNNSGAALARPGESGHQHTDTGGGLSTGVEISAVGPILTGDKGSDQLLRDAHNDRLKAAREVLSRQKSQHAQDMAAAKKRQAALDKPASNRLSWLAERSMDSTWRAMEIQAFARAIGAAKFEVTCSSSNPKEKSVRKVYTAEQLRDPATIKSMSHMSARRFGVAIQPDLGSGVILVKGLDADGIKNLEAIGLSPAATVGVAGKFDAWIKTGTKITAEERTALIKRLETLTGVEQKHGGAGSLVGFSSAQKAVSLTTCAGQVAPAARELLEEVRGEIFEAKAQAEQAKIEADGKAWQALFGEANPVQPAIKQPEPVLEPLPEPKAGFEAKPSKPVAGDLETSTEGIDAILGLTRDKDGQIIKPKSTGGDGTSGTALG